MTNNKIKIMIGYLMLIAGVVFLFKDGLGIKFTDEELAGAAMVIFGLPSVYFSMNYRKRNFLFASSVLFFTGVLLIVQSQYFLYDTRALIFTSILFITGASLFILYIESPHEKILLIASIILMLFGYLSSTYSKQIGLVKIVNVIADTAENFWPAILIVVGIVIFANRKR